MNHAIYKRMIALAADYYREFGTSLSGLTGEIGEYYAAISLDLKLAVNGTPGYDGVDKNNKLHQIKSAVSKSTPNTFSHINVKHNWHYIDFVFMSKTYKLIGIYQLTKEDLKLAQTKAGIKYKSITEAQIKEYGKIVSSNRRKTQACTLEVSKTEYIRRTVYDNPYIRTDALMNILKKQGYDISNRNSINSILCKVKAGRL